METRRISDLAIAQAFAEFQDATIAVPVGHYDDTKGSSTYNWRRSFESAVLDRAAELDATAAPVVVGEDARNAARYLFLRNQDGYKIMRPFICIFAGSFGQWTGEYADREIDAAMAAALAGD